MSPTFERFTERARQVVVLAQEEARQVGDDHIGTEHLLAGLLLEEEGLAARALATLGVTIDRVRTTMRESYEAPRTKKLPFTYAAEKALELALGEALALGHNYIGTEHILLGVVREEETCVPEIRDTLSDLLDGDLQSVRGEVMRLLSGLPPKKQEDESTESELTEDQIRQGLRDRSLARVKHKAYDGLCGALLEYDFIQQRCKVQLTGMPDVKGQFTALRSDLRRA